MARPGRPPKRLVYDADAATIRDAFARRRAMQDETTAARSALRSDLEAAGVHAGTLGIVDRLVNLPPGRRAYFVALLRRYLDVLADELADDPEAPPPTNVGHNNPPPVEEKPPPPSPPAPPTPQDVFHRTKGTPGTGFDGPERTPGGGFDEGEQAAIDAALEAGKVERAEQGEWPDAARPELLPNSLRRAALRGGPRRR